MKKIIQGLRHIIQLAAFVIVPGLFITVLSALRSIAAAIVSGTYSFSVNGADSILLVVILGVTAVFGRYFCGFLCAFGSMQELFGRIGNLGKMKLRVPEKADHTLKYFKYAVLAFVIIGIWILGLTGDIVWSPWTVFGMVATIGSMPQLKYMISIGGLLLIMIAVGSIFIERFFCKYVCPLGAIFTIISAFRPFKIKKPTAGCRTCRACTNNCPMSIPLYTMDEVSSGECINCLQCSAVCARNNVDSDAAPALAGIMTTAAVSGVYLAGVLPVNADVSRSSDSYFSDSVEGSNGANSTQKGNYTDGVYQGSGTGFRGTIDVIVTVENGMISAIDIDSYSDDREFFEKAKSGVIEAILDSQDTDVDVVSGATFSSRGLIEAVENALLGNKSESENDYPSDHTESNADANVEKEYAGQEDTSESKEAADTNDYIDGVYTGTGTGFRGETKVSVTVENGTISDITIESYQDDEQFFERAKDSVIDAIINAQSTDVSTVSGATYSSNGIIEAVANALGTEYSNPNQEHTEEFHHRGGKHMGH